jgi:hypothetical protein
LIQELKEKDKLLGVEFRPGEGEFMKDSKNPDAFPSKKELLEAGRMDLSNEDEEEQENGKISLRSAIETQ